MANSPQVQTLLDQYTTPLYAGPTSVFDAAAPIQTLLASIGKQIIEYRTEIDAISTSNPPVEIIGQIEHLYQTIGAIQLQVQNMATAIHTLTGMWTQWANYMTAFRAATTPPASVTVACTSPIEVGGTATATATAKDASGNYVPRSVTWATSDATIATINTSGIVTGVKAGAVTITATTTDGVAGTISVTVQTTVATVTITGLNPTVKAGSTDQATATPRDASGNALPDPVTWTTSNAAIATVSATGLVTGVAAGTVTITATAGGVSATDSVTIN